MATTVKQPKIKILTTKQYKLDKGESLNVATFGLQLAPATEAGNGINLCPSAGDCVRGCIKVTGMNAFPSHRSARVKRTILYKKFPQAFHDQLQAEIESWKRSTTNAGFTLAARPNTLSDQPLLAKAVAERNPDIQVYDYTKLPKPASRRLANYHLTYSYSEKSTTADIQHCIDHKVNIAVILNIKRGQPLPAFVDLHGRTFPVIDGDLTDLRFMDPSDQTYVVGLRWKTGKGSAENLAAGLKSGLVIDPAVQAAQRKAA